MKMNRLNAVSVYYTGKFLIFIQTILTVSHATKPLMPVALKWFSLPLVFVVNAAETFHFKCLQRMISSFNRIRIGMKSGACRVNITHEVELSSDF